MQKIVTHIKDNNGHVLMIPSSGELDISSIMTEYFEPSFWQNKGQIVGQSKGRNTTWFIDPQDINFQNNQWVLRHYYRGGLVAKLISDHYFYTTLEATRCYRELEILQQMVALQLPVPKPIAARMIRSGLFYQADLIMQKIAATDLVAILKQTSLSENMWREVGKIIAKFHQNGIDHADLNSHNIMIDNNNKVWLIDFDRGSIKPPEEPWQLKNIERLHRSLIKEKGLHEPFHFNKNDWVSLIDGYMGKSNR